MELTSQHRLLVLLDACQSGSVTSDGAEITPNADRLRSAIAASNITVLTSSSANEVSREDLQWSHDAFTKALLEALGQTADTNHKGAISMSELTAFLSAKVPELTDRRQHVGLSQGFQDLHRALFVTGL